MSNTLFWTVRNAHPCRNMWRNRSQTILSSYPFFKTENRLILPDRRCCLHFTSCRSFNELWPRNGHDLWSRQILTPLGSPPWIRLFSENPKTPENEGKPAPEPEDVGLTFDEELAQLSFVQRYKKLLKQYWYVLLPVHGVTSVCWFGFFFILASCGVTIDVGYIGELAHLPDAVVTYLKNPKLGNLAVAAACYKLATPFRYMSTVYAVVPAIKALVRRGLIKPIPKLTSRRAIQQEVTAIKENVQTIKNRVIKKRGE